MWLHGCAFIYVFGYSESFQKICTLPSISHQIKMITDRNFSITDRPPARLPSGTLDSIAEDQEEEPVSNSRPHFIRLMIQCMTVSKILVQFQGI